MNIRMKSVCPADKVHAFSEWLYHNLGPIPKSAETIHRDYLDLIVNDPEHIEYFDDLTLEATRARMANLDFLEMRAMPRKSGAMTNMYSIKPASERDEDACSCLSDLGRKALKMVGG